MELDKHPWKQLINSKERADFVKNLRCVEGHTWRSVASHCATEWKGGWGSNQIAGMYICETAADFLKEDNGTEPWN